MESKLQKLVISLDDSDDEVVILLDDSKVVISLDDSDDEVQICEPFETKKRKCKTRREREYEMLADLTDFPELAAMFAAEKIWRRNRKKKNKKKRKKKAIESEAQNQKVHDAEKEEERAGNEVLQNLSADATEEENLAHSSEAVKTIAFKASDEARSADVIDLSSLTPEKDEETTSLGISDGPPTKAIVSEELTRIAQESVADATEEENQAHFYEAVETIAVKACDDAAEVTDLSSLSLKKDEVTTNLGSSDVLGEMVPITAIISEELTRIKAQVSDPDATEEENQAHSYEAVKTIAFKACDDARSAEVTDLSSLSLKKDEVTTNLGSSDGLGEMVPTTAIISEELTRFKTRESDADATEEETRPHSYEAVKTIACKACDGARSAEVTDLSSLSLKKDEVTTNLRSSDGLGEMVPGIISEELPRIKAQESDADATGEENQAHSYEAVKTIAFKACDDASSAEVTDLSSLSLEKDQVTTNLGSSDGLGKTVLTKAIDVEIADVEKQVYSSKDETKSVETTENIVLRKLLRGPRYFDYPESSRETCFSCGADNHIAVNCLVKKHKKPCYICGGFEHIAKHCKQRNACTICGGIGHLKKDCAEKHPADSGSSKFCLRCGDSGHDMFLCNNEYSPDDLKKIECYVCKGFGHLCCAEFNNEDGPRQVSCYYCGESGHLGSGCPKLHRDTDGSQSTFQCFKCGEEGHYARNCLKVATAKPETVDLTTPERFPVEKKGTIGLGCSNPELGSHKMQYKKIVNTSEDQSGRMHRVNTIRPQNLFNGEARANVWLSPALSAKMSKETPAFSGFHQVPGPQQKVFHQVSGPQYPQQGFQQASGPRYPQQQGFQQASGPQHPQQQGFQQASGPQYPQQQGFQQASGPQYPQQQGFQQASGPQYPQQQGFQQVSGPQYPKQQVFHHPKQQGFHQVSGPQQNFNHYAGSPCTPQAYQPFSVLRHNGS